MVVPLLRKSRNASSGFTLIELLTVIAIIIIFSAIILASNENATNQAYTATYMQQGKELQNSIDQWVAVQPTVAGAYTAFGNASDPASQLALAQQMMEFNSRSSFSVQNGYIVSEASTRSGIGWTISWPVVNPGDQFKNGPVVAQVTLP